MRRHNRCIIEASGYYKSQVCVFLRSRKRACLRVVYAHDIVTAQEHVHGLFGIPEQSLFSKRINLAIQRAAATRKYQAVNARPYGTRAIHADIDEGTHKISWSSAAVGAPRPSLRICGYSDVGRKRSVCAGVCSWAIAEI
jgi:hypothetical protein